MHYITSHCMTFHTSHCTALYLPYITLHCDAFIVFYCVAYDVLHWLAWHDICITLHCLQCITLCYVALCCIALHYAVLICFVYYFTLHRLAFVALFSISRVHTSLVLFFEMDLLLEMKQLLRGWFSAETVRDFLKSPVTSRYHIPSSRQNTLKWLE